MNLKKRVLYKLELVKPITQKYINIYSLRFSAVSDSTNFYCLYVVQQKKRKR